MEDFVYVKGKEAVGVNILLGLVVIIFIVPIIAIFILRGLYKLIFALGKSKELSESVNGVIEKI